MKLTGIIYFLALGVMVAWCQTTFRIMDMGVEFAPPSKTTKKLAEMVGINFMVTLPFSSTKFICRARQSERTTLPTEQNYVCFPLQYHGKVAFKLREDLTYIAMDNVVLSVKAKS